MPYLTRLSKFTIKVAGMCISRNHFFLSRCIYMTLFIEAASPLPAEPPRCPLALSQTAGEVRCFVHLPVSALLPKWPLTPCLHLPTGITARHNVTICVCPATPDSVSLVFISSPASTASACPIGRLQHFSIHYCDYCLLIGFCGEGVGRQLILFCLFLTGLLWAMMGQSLTRRRTSGHRRWRIWRHADSQGSFGNLR